MRCFAGLTSVFCFALAAFAQTPPAHFEIRWDTNHSSVAVIGAIPAELQKASSEKLAEVFPVTVEPKNVLAAINLPAMLGTYAVRSNALEFQPKFPFEAGMTYRATFVPLHEPSTPHPDPLPSEGSGDGASAVHGHNAYPQEILPAKVSATLTVPRRTKARTTVVSEVYPTADVLPQNLLKFYVHFSAPMSRGHIYEHIHLVTGEGTTVELPFLEIDEELWNPEMTRLTLFLDPGRIKRGVRPLEEVGPALYPDKNYTLVIDEGWQDARGVPLKESFRKKFHVTLPDREPPEPAAWKIGAPKAFTREPLTIRFTDPMDEALALRMIAVRSVSGEKSLREHEMEWVFTPEQAWKPGRYQILVQSTIEDLAGNNIGKPFEVDLEESDRPRDPARTISLWFEVK